MTVNNRNNYYENGTVKPRRLRSKWIVSNHEKRLRNKLYDIERKIKETRKKEYNNFAKKLRSIGDVVKIDDDSYKGWQSSFGKSIGFNAPSMLVSSIERVFKNSGGQVVKLNTRKTKSSQTCPNCGNQTKKELKERIHKCECGFHTQRDIASAILNMFVDVNGAFDTDKTQCFIKEKEPLLRRCVKEAIDFVQQRPSLYCSLGKVSELEQILNPRNDIKLLDDASLAYQIDTREGLRVKEEISSKNSVLSTT